MAFANPLITAYAVEATEFPDLARRYQVSGVPKTVVNEEVEIMGGLPQDAFIQQALLQFTIDKAKSANNAELTNKAEFTTDTIGTTGTTGTTGTKGTLGTEGTKGSA
jgi:hypothetical protein